MTDIKYRIETVEAKEVISCWDTVQKNPNIILALFSTKQGYIVGDPTSKKPETDLLTLRRNFPTPTNPLYIDEKSCFICGLFKPEPLTPSKNLAEHIAHIFEKEIGGSRKSIHIIDNKNRTAWMGWGGKLNNDLVGFGGVLSMSEEAPKMGIEGLCSVNGQGYIETNDPIHSVKSSFENANIPTINLKPMKNNQWDIIKTDLENFANDH